MHLQIQVTNQKLTLTVLDDNQEANIVIEMRIRCKSKALKDIKTSGYNSKGLYTEYRVVLREIVPKLPI